MNLAYLALFVAGGESMTPEEWYAATSIVGMVLLSIIGTIVAVVFLSVIFTKPRRSKVTGIFFASVLLQVIGAIIFAYIMGVLFSFIVPPPP